MALQVYGRRDCPMCAQVTHFLTHRGVLVQPHDVLTDPPSTDDLVKALRTGEVSELVDPAAAAQAGLNPGACSTERMAAWLHGSPEALRQPLIVRGATVLTASDLQQLECLLY